MTVRINTQDIGQFAEDINKLASRAAARPGIEGKSDVCVGLDLRPDGTYFTFSEESGGAFCGYGDRNIPRVGYLPKSDVDAFREKHGVEHELDIECQYDSLFGCHTPLVDSLQLFFDSSFEVQAPRTEEIREIPNLNLFRGNRRAGHKK